jgi:hypothetical protein
MPSDTAYGSMVARGRTYEYFGPNGFPSLFCSEGFAAKIATGRPYFANTAGKAKARFSPWQSSCPLGCDDGFSPCRIKMIVWSEFGGPTRKLPPLELCAETLVTARTNPAITVNVRPACLLMSTAYPMIGRDSGAESFSLHGWGGK